MISRIDLSGSWDFCLDNEKAGLERYYYKAQFSDSISLPTTASEAKKGTPSDIMNTYFLTDPYLSEGYTWYSKKLEFEDYEGREFFLILERTRISHVWIDETYVGSDNTLCTSHRYRITPFINKPEHRLTIMVDNTSYPVRGGHMTSQDTQTNWNGITGNICIEVFPPVYLSGIKLYPDAVKKLVKVEAVLNGLQECQASFCVTEQERKVFPVKKITLSPGMNEYVYELDDTAKLWSEFTPDLYTLQITLAEDEKDQYQIPFGLRDFKAKGKYFEINGQRTFLRGKHDGLIFPMTGYAPTDLNSWMEVFATAKSYGINHYRFHTCCPPAAAFTAADLSGIYLEPELPFWGTVTEEGEANHDGKAQQYLINEGFHILDEFGNHPSFVMMSMGNELWGSKKVLNDILGDYKRYDDRHLYTQGSNNFQFVPCILENEDFSCGVRFSRDRLFRGSYAMCDAPQGHIQTMAPNSNYNYDNHIRPISALGTAEEGKDIMIQYGTSMKTVKADASDELIPHIPVVSHEIGQYAMYPDYCEIDKYTGVLKARNLEAFKERIEKEGMLAQAGMFFGASGRFASQCYKAELETALRSNELAGFQILDLQDFTGQGTALVGILNAFLENKGVISEDEWSEFCSDTVLMAKLPKFIFHSGEVISVGIELAHFGLMPVTNPIIKLRISGVDGEGTTIEENINKEFMNGVHNLCDFKVTLPDSMKPQKLVLSIEIAGTGIKNHYDLWIYPVTPAISYKSTVVTISIDEALKELEKGKNVLLFPENLNDANSIQGTYCTDFWCYPMFRSISESMNRPVPIGTLGMLIDKEHPLFNDFPTEQYTSAQWYDIISASRPMKLNGTGIEPMAWMIDNFERNNRLGLLYELQAEKGKLLVCTADLRGFKGSLPASWLLYSLLNYMESDRFMPKVKMEADTVRRIFKG